MPKCAGVSACKTQRSWHNELTAKLCSRGPARRSNAELTPPTRRCISLLPPMSQHGCDRLFSHRGKAQQSRTRSAAHDLQGHRAITAVGGSPRSKLSLGRAKDHRPAPTQGTKTSSSTRSMARFRIRLGDDLIDALSGIVRLYPPQHAAHLAERRRQPRADRRHPHTPRASSSRSSSCATPNCLLRTREWRRSAASRPRREAVEVLGPPLGHIHADRGACASSGHPATAKGLKRHRGWLGPAYCRLRGSRG